jgi:ADP-glucose pyrophosphorylase
MLSIDGKFYLLDLERTIRTGKSWYWKANRHGYTQYISQAGRFTEDDAQKIADADYTNMTIIIPEEKVDRIMNE